jgi:hypothetical protein
MFEKLSEKKSSTSSATMESSSSPESPLALIRQSTKQLFGLHAPVAQTAAPSATTATELKPDNAADDPYSSNRSQSDVSSLKTVDELPSHSNDPMNMDLPRSKLRTSLLCRPFHVFGSKRDFGICVDESVDSYPSVQGPNEYEYGDDGEPNLDDEHDRRHFKAIRSIPRKALENLVLDTLYTDDSADPRYCRILFRNEGSFYHCVFIGLDLPVRSNKNTSCASQLMVQQKIGRKRMHSCFVTKLY